MALNTEPFWAAPALLAAVIASLGYVGKTAINLALEIAQTARDRRSRLAEIYAVIRAGDAAFSAQNALRSRLSRQLRARFPEANDHGWGDERLFSELFHLMNNDERELHSLIRAMTVHTFYPLNQELLQWLRSDSYFRAASPADSRIGRLAIYFTQLESHLVLWMAKYEIWMPDHPEHALVFLADEEKHGIGFPRAGALLIAKVLGHPTMSVKG